MAAAADMGRLRMDVLRDRMASELDDVRDVVAESPIEVTDPGEMVAGLNTGELRNIHHIKLCTFADLLDMFEEMADSADAMPDTDTPKLAMEKVNETSPGGAFRIATDDCGSALTPCGDASKPCARVRASSCMAGSYALSCRTQRRMSLRGRSARPAGDGASPESSRGLQRGAANTAVPRPAAQPVPVLPSGAPPKAQGRRAFHRAAQQTAGHA
uniref:Uncharacterized protein n=1 Tax=Pyrodinium bahamense TaxID=73915 RepID=A0A7S0A245_9DINO